MCRWTTPILQPPPQPDPHGITPKGQRKVVTSSFKEKLWYGQCKKQNYNDGWTFRMFTVRAMQETMTKYFPDCLRYGQCAKLCGTLERTEEIKFGPVVAKTGQSLDTKTAAWQNTTSPLVFHPARIKQLETKALKNRFVKHLNLACGSVVWHACRLP